MIGVTHLALCTSQTYQKRSSFSIICLVVALQHLQRVGIPSGRLVGSELMESSVAGESGVVDGLLQFLRLSGMRPVVRQFSDSGSELRSALVFDRLSDRPVGSCSSERRQIMIKGVFKQSVGKAEPPGCLTFYKDPGLDRGLERDHKILLVDVDDIRQ